MILFLRRFYIRIRLFVLPKGRSGQLSSLPWWARGSDVSRANRTVDVPSGPAMRRPAPTRRKSCRIEPKSCSQQDLSNPKPGHTTGRSGRGGAWRGGEGGRGWVGRDAVGSIRPGDNTTLPLPLQRIEETVLEVSSEARNNKVLCKPMEERNQRLTRGLSAVYQRDR